MEVGSTLHPPAGILLFKEDGVSAPPHLALPCKIVSDCKYSAISCCASSEGASDPKASQAKSTPTGGGSTSQPKQKTTGGSSSGGAETQPEEAKPSTMSSGHPDYKPSNAKGAKAFLPATAASNPNQDVSEPAAVPTSKSSGPKAVRGWAPPAKEWDKETKSKGDETRIEINEEWDEDGNLVRTTTKKIKTPDWKWKTTKTTEVIPASEAAKMGKTQK